jgi:FkbM family methyltransferase
MQIGKILRLVKTLKYSVKNLHNHNLTKDKLFSTFFQVVLWQLYKRIVKKPLIINLFNNARFIARPDCTVSSSIMYTKIPDYDEIMFLRKQLKSESIIFDVGANVGHFSLFFSDIAERTYAFEPTPKTFSVLRDNFAINGDKKLEMYQCALSDHDGIVIFLDQGGLNTTNRVTETPSRCTVEVQSMRLDTFCRDKNITKIDLLKMDVEGHEFEVLKGAVYVLKDIIPEFVLFELLSMERLSIFEKFFNEFGYVIYAVRNGVVVNGIKNFYNKDNLFASPKNFFKTLKEQKGY